MFRKLLLTCAFLGASPLLHAAVTTLSGPVSDSMTGPLLSGEVYHVTSDITVPAGQVLTVQPGAIVKFGSSHLLQVIGTLDVQGTALAPVIFTSLLDDSAGGDTPTDGDTSGSAGDWCGILYLAGSDASTLTQAEIRYAGDGNVTALRVTSAVTATFADLTISDCLSHGLSLTNAGPTFTDTHFQDVGGVVIDFMPLDAAENFAGTTSAGSGLHRMTIAATTIAGSTTLSPANTLNGDSVLYLAGQLGISGTLTLEAGLIVKVSLGHEISGNGTLNVNGTPAQPVYFTSFADDTLGGDENGDGPTTGTSGDWRRIALSGPVPSSLNHCELRFAGRSGVAAITVLSEQNFDHVTVRDCLSDGLFVLNDFPLTVHSCTFENNAGIAVRAGSLNTAPGYLDNFAQGNSGGNTIRYAGTTLSADLTIGVRNGIAGVVNVAGMLIVPSGFRMTVEAGVILKFAGAVRWTVDGAVDLLGTEGARILVTSLQDDEGGDTNGDGALTAPAKGDWQSFIINDVADTSTIEHVEFRYPGGAYLAGVLVRSPNATLRNLSVRHSLRGAFDLFAFVEARHLLAFDCFRGFLLFGAGDLINATAVDSTIGFDKLAGATHRVLNSIAWNNVTDFSGFGSGEVLFSNGAHGLSGLSGNIDTDPLFVDDLNGDLRLQLGSPCIDSGDPTSPLDPDATRADMGAQFFDHCQPRPFCTAKLNSLGCLPQVGFTGAASVSDPSAFDITFSNVLNNKNGLLFYGFAPAALPFLGGTLCVQPPLRRTPVINSFGNPPPDDCSGVFSFDFNAWIQGANDPLLVAGAQVSAQLWSRDVAHPDGTGIGLSDALQFGVCP